MDKYQSVSQLRKENLSQPLSPVQTGDLNKPAFGGGITVEEQTNGYEYSENYGYGDNNFGKGPLSNLYANPYKGYAIGYPKDLGFINRGHVIQFDIREIKPQSFQVVKDFRKTVADLYKTGDITEIEQSSRNTSKNVVDFVKKFDVGDTISNMEKGIESVSQIKFTPETYKDKVDTIRLYMPDTLNFSYNAQYDKLSLSEAINSVPLVAKVSTAITSILENKMAKLLSNKLGYTFNPQQQMLFEGIDFREFDLQFVFTPSSPSESDAVKQIIRKLRRAAAPERKTAAGGFFFIPPSIFEISFFFNGEYNTNITPIRPCVLQGITVDYAPNGWSALRDGSPVQTSISLSFKEIELIDKASIDDER